MNLFTNEFSPRLEIAHSATIGKHISILGMTGSGKTNTGYVWVEEELGAGGRVLIIDPEGDYYALKECFPVLIIGKARRGNPVDLEVAPGQGSAIANALADKNVSVILDLSGLPTVEQNALATEYLSALWQQYQETDLPPCRVVIDEIHLFAPQGKGTESKELIQDIASRGRKRGFALLIATQRPQRVDKTVLDSTSIRFFHWMEAGAGLNAVSDLVPATFSPRDTIPGLLRGQCIIKMERESAIQQVRPANTFHPDHASSGSVGASVAIDATLLESLRKILQSPADVTATRANPADVLLQEENAELRREIETLKVELAAALNAAKSTAPMSPAPVPNHPHVDVFNERAIKSQQRAFDQFIHSLREYPSHHRIIVAYLTQNDTREYTVRELAARTGYKPITITSKAPVQLIKEGVLTRRGAGDGAIYKSVARAKFEQAYPDLDIETLLTRLLSACNG